MLNVGKIENGVVLDHIQAGRALYIYQDLHLAQRRDISVALIQNARSNQMGRKDILKIEAPEGQEPEMGLNFDDLAYIDQDFTIDVIKNGKVCEKRRVNPPDKIRNVIRCQNPRCITTIEQELPQVFELSKDEHLYRCIYCEQAYRFNIQL